MNDGTRTHKQSCFLCEAGCGVLIATDGTNILSIKPNKNDVLSKGHICPKGVAMQDLHEDPDRLTHPVVRKGDRWVEVSWDEALDTAARLLVDIQSRHGYDAVGTYAGNPTGHTIGLVRLGPFFSQFRTKSLYSVASIDSLPNQLICYLMYGHQFYLAAPDIDRTSHLFIIGSNPMVSNGSLWTTPGFPDRVKKMQARGGRLVVVDPRRTETAQVADEFVPIRPGSDAWLLLSMVHVLLRENWVRPGHLADVLVGMEEMRAAVAPFTPEAASLRTGIASDDIIRLARDLYEADRAAVYGRLGVCVQEFGLLCQWGIELLNILTGNMDREGGTLIAQPAVPLMVDPAGAGGLGRWNSHAHGIRETMGAVPLSTLADDILTPGDRQVRAMVILAGNPVSSVPNGRQLEKAFADLEGFVAIDFYINETTRYASVILPPTSPLCRENYDIAPLTWPVRNVSKFSMPLFPKPDDEMHDWEIIDELIERIAIVRGEAAPAKLPTPVEIVDAMLKTNPWHNGLSIDLLKANPDGVDLGALQPTLVERLLTPDKRIHLAPDLCLEDLPRLFAKPLPAEGELVLIGRRSKRSKNSWMHNANRLVKGKKPHQLLVNAADLASRGIRHGQMASLRSKIGAIEVEVEESSEIQPGVVCLQHGWGQHRAGVHLAVAITLPGSSFNDIADDAALDVASGTAVLNGIPVSLETIVQTQNNALLEGA